MKLSWGGSLRLRLTVAFGVMFLAAGAAVLAGVMILVRNSMNYSLGIVFDGKQYSEYDYTTKQQILSSMLDNLFVKGGLTVLAVWVLATVAGWFLAGRLLRPLSMITTTTEHISRNTLHRRIALDMPPGEVKTLADSFDRMLDRLDNAFASQGRFIANAAHELKTPLTLNRTLVEVAMQRTDSPQEVRSLGEKLLTVNSRHERLIDSLLTLARADEIGATRSPVDLADLAEAAVETTAMLAEEHEVRVETALIPTPTFGDPILLEQIVRNLVDNAIRYNKPGGWVRVETRNGPQWVDVVVVNTGELIEQSEVPELFLPFRRLTDRIGSARGSGLGLSIVRAVAHAHGGTASAAPNRAGGLAVWATLPRRAVAGPIAVQSEPVAGD